MKTFLGCSTGSRLVSTLPIFLFLFLAASSSPANDTEAVVAAGGIQFKYERRISMEKERLFISEKKVTVDYDFLNHSDQDITTLVAFPLPAVDCLHQEFCPANLFDDFRVFVGGRNIPIQTEIKALVGDKDYATVLGRFNIDIAGFGHFEPSAGNQQNHDDFERLSETQQKELIHLGIFSSGGEPLWTVAKTYYWSQTFPAKKTLHVSHEYQPIVGFNHVTVENLDPDARKDNIAEALARPKGAPGSDRDDYWLPMAKEMDNVCVDSSLARKVKEAESEQWKTRVEQSGKPSSPVEIDQFDVGVLLVEYILSTATSWQGPIKDFTLIVERPSAEGTQKYFVSFCWDDPVRRLDENHFEAHTTNFVPRKELHVAFLVPNS